MKTKLRMKNITNLAGDLTAFTIGYSLSDPAQDPILGTLLQIMPSQPIIDEIAKMIAGLVIGVLSRAAYTALEKWQNRRKRRKNESEETEPQQPEEKEVD